MDALTRLALVPRRPPRSDLILAAVLFVWALLDALFGHGPGTRWERVLFATVTTVPIVFRRRAPLLVAVFLAGAIVVWASAATVAEGGTMPFPSLLVMLFSVALYERRLAAAVTGGLVLVGSMFYALESRYGTGLGASNAAIFVFFILGAWGAGRLILIRAEQAHRAYAETEQLARSAVSEERARIARELHDVVAHSISIVAVQAGAAEELLDRDPERARAHLQAVRSTAREAMTEMRRVVDVLREDDAPYAPLPGLSRLDDLVTEARAAGIEVDIVEEGERPQLPAGLDLVIFRIVQEALTNVRKHAGGAHASVRLSYARSALEIDIRDDGDAVASAPGSAGHGLIGMRERVNLFGGTLAAGSADGGGFRVHAVLPLEEAPA